MSPARSVSDEPLRDRDQQLVAARVAERVVDRLEAVEVDEQHADHAVRARRALLRLAQPVQEQRAVGEVGERIVQRAVDRVGMILRVGQREAGVLGEGDEDVALVGVVAAALGTGGDGEQAAGHAVPGHRSAHQATDALGGQRRIGDVAVLDHVKRQCSDVGPLGKPAHARAVRLIHEARGGHETKQRRILLVEQPQRDDLVADQFAGADDDRVEQRLEVGAAHDRALDLRQPLEQRLTASQGADELQRAHGLGQCPGHPAQQSRLLDVERLVFARQGEPGGSGLVERRRDAARPRCVGRLAGPEADARDDLAVAHNHARLGLEGLGGALDAGVHRGVHVLVGAEHREVLGQLLGGPGVRERVHDQPSARTTSVWLWKPLIPRVRAISPNV